MTKTREQVQETLRKQAERQREAATRPFYTIKGFDQVLGGTYENDEVYHDRGEAQAHCRRMEHVVEWTFSHEQYWMDNSSDMVFANKYGQERTRAGMFAHGDAC
jgi:hypothetical protein